jgi:hypothetical protein
VLGFPDTKFKDELWSARGLYIAKMDMGEIRSQDKLISYKLRKFRHGYLLHILAGSGVEQGSGARIHF